MTKENPKILVVDDEPDVTAYFQSYFVRRGFLVNTTGNGADALSMIKALHPDLVVLDRVIPDMNGLEVLRELRKFDKDTKVIILTGHNLESDQEREEFYELGISEYFEKPVHLKEIEDIIVDLLGKGGEPVISRPRNITPPTDKSFRELAHKMKNILGNIRSQCEVFLLNKKDGLYKDKSKQELEAMSDEIISDVLKAVDQAVDVLNKE